MTDKEWTTFCSKVKQDNLCRDVPFNDSIEVWLPLNLSRIKIYKSGEMCFVTTCPNCDEELEIDFFFSHKMEETEQVLRSLGYLEGIK